jgi:hypothetical protein
MFSRVFPYFPSSPAFSHARRGEKEPKRRAKTRKINPFWNPLPARRVGESRVRESLRSHQQPILPARRKLLPGRTSGTLNVELPDKLTQFLSLHLQT